jgi:hypothetical protein
MNVPMDKIFGPKNTHEPQKSGKAPMAGVVFIVDTLGRGMGQEDIHKTTPQKPIKEQLG